MKQLLALLLRHSRRAVVFATAAGVLSGGANAVLLALANSALHRPRPWEDPWLVGGFVALCLILPAMRAASSFLLAGLGQRVVLGLRLELCRRVIAAPLRAVEELGTHRVFAALTEDVAAVAAAVALFPLLFVQGAIVAGCLVYLGWLSPTALAMVAAMLALGIVTYRLPTRRGARWQREQRELAERLWRHFGGVTGGLKELKLHEARRGELMAEMTQTGDRLREAAVRTTTLFAAAAGWGQMVIFALLGTVVFALPALRQSVSVPALTGYALVLLYLMTPLEVILDSVPVLSRARVALQKVEALGLSLGAPAAAAPAARAGGTEWRTLELAQVRHSYRREGADGEFTLGPLNLSVRRGELLFVVGGNGSGKTTLAKLLVGLYTPADGEVRLDGRPVTDETRDAYLQQFSAVFSDFHLFDTLLGLDPAGLDERAARYLERLQLSRKVAVDGGRLSTTALSQGQRKRLALLVAYLEDRPVYLFDEWAADQDPTFKKLFYLELLPELRARGKTVIVISHDDHFYPVADRVIKLDEGRIEYDGGSGGLRFGGIAGQAQPA
jgi:putative pyoverdin transport system ATP-binding/permease protein